MALFRKPRPDSASITPKRPVPDGLWVKCDACGDALFQKQLEENLKVCPTCQHHFRLTARERIKLLMDDGTFEELPDGLKSSNPLQFPEYEEKLSKSIEKTGMTEAVITGFGALHGCRVGLGAMEFQFMGASMGSVCGEKITRLVEEAIPRRAPVIIVSCSGGARMQEGVLSLMQLAKTSAALARFHEAGLLYLSVLTDPTTGGVTASFGMLGDVIVAEPKALIGFAGPRVIEQTIRQRLPKGFQRSEFLLEHGMVDVIAHRRDLKATVARLISLLAA